MNPDKDLFGSDIAIDNAKPIPQNVADFINSGPVGPMPAAEATSFIEWFCKLEELKTGPRGLLDACKKAQIVKSESDGNFIISFIYTPFVSPTVSFYQSTRTLVGISERMTDIVRKKIGHDKVGISFERSHPAEIEGSPFSPDFIAQIYDQPILPALDEAHIKMSLVQHPAIKKFPRSVAHALLHAKTRIIKALAPDLKVSFTINTGIPFRPEDDSEGRFSVMSEQARFEDAVARLLQFGDGVIPEVRIVYNEPLPEPPRTDTVLPVDSTIVHPVGERPLYDPPLLFEPIITDIRQGRIGGTHFIRQTNLEGGEEDNLRDELYMLAKERKIPCFDIDCPDLKRSNAAWGFECSKMPGANSSNPIDDFFRTVRAAKKGILFIRGLETAFGTTESRKLKTLPRIMDHLNSLKTALKNPQYMIVIVSPWHQNSFLHDKPDELVEPKENMLGIAGLHRMIERASCYELDNETQSYASSAVRGNRMNHRLFEDFPLVAEGANLFEMEQVRHQRRFQSLPDVAKGMAQFFKKMISFEKFLHQLQKKGFEFNVEQLTYFFLTENGNCDIENFFNEFFINWVTIRIAKFYPEYIEPGFSGNLDKLDETSVDIDDLLTEDGSVFRAYVLASSLLHMFPARFPEMEKHREKWFKQIFAHVPGVGNMKLQSFLASLEEILNGKVEHQYISTLPPEDDTPQPEDDTPQPTPPPINPDLERLLSRNRARRSDFLRHVYTLGIEPFSAQETKIS